MVYSNGEFLIFFMILIAMYLGLRTKGQRFTLLLFGSICFYAWTGIFDTTVFLAVVFASWIALILAEKYKHKKLLFVSLGISIITFHLLFWKYFPWINSEIQRIFPNFLGGKKIHFSLPLGVSFFTLQGIAYLVDYNRGQTSYMGFKNFALFKSFFPQLISGPIVRAQQLMPQLQALRMPSPSDVHQGLHLFILGFFKKLFIADYAAPFVDTVFFRPGEFNRSTLIWGLVAFAVQAWSDFSGYTDMGRGAAKMLGIHLPENFYSPYYARTPSEFWHRWHITLSQWIRDYIYTPLALTFGRYSQLHFLFVFVLTMVISGLWHGASWTYAFFGIYHGLLLAGESKLKRTKIMKNLKSSTPIFFQRISLTVMMWFFTLIGWLIFRSNSFSDMLVYSKGIISNSGVHVVGPQSIAYGLFVMMILQFLLYFDTKKQVWLYPKLANIFHQKNNANELVRNYVPTALVIYVLFVLLMLLFVSHFLRSSFATSTFIYFQF